jgi:glycosyltransferase involved in cell wall biosynthesis
VPPIQDPLRVAFLGRLAPEKGPDTLIRALRTLPAERIQLDLYGSGSEGTAAYREVLENLAARDARITIHPPVASQRVIPMLRGYHVLAVPSRWLETGPLVALEAFAAGVPILGSDLGGIAELVRPGVNGLLIDVDSVESWASTLQQLSGDRTLLGRLRAGVCPPRRFDDLARDMTAVYASLLLPAAGISGSAAAAGRA